MWDAMGAVEQTNVVCVAEHVSAYSADYVNIGAAEYVNVGVSEYVNVTAAEYVNVGGVASDKSKSATVHREYVDMGGNSFRCRMSPTGSSTIGDSSWQTEQVTGYVVMCRPKPSDSITESAVRPSSWQWPPLVPARITSAASTNETASTPTPPPTALSMSGEYPDIFFTDVLPRHIASLDGSGHYNREGSSGEDVSDDNADRSAAPAKDMKWPSLRSPVPLPRSCWSTPPMIEDEYCNRQPRGDYHEQSVISELGEENDVGRIGQLDQEHRWVEARGGGVIQYAQLDLVKEEEEPVDDDALASESISPWVLTATTQNSTKQGSESAAGCGGTVGYTTISWPRTEALSALRTWVQVINRP